MTTGGARLPRASELLAGFADADTREPLAIAHSLARNHEQHCVDVWVAAHLRQDERAARHTETYGMIVDRMAIGWVRVRQMSGHDRLPVAETQLAELASAHDTLVADVEAGRRSLPRWRSLKFYRTPAGAHT